MTKTFPREFLHARGGFISLSMDRGRVHQMSLQVVLAEHPTLLWLGSLLRP